jgi:hypothetical protein
MKSGAVGETRINEWCGVVESTPSSCCQALREPTHFILAGELDLTSDKTCAFVDPYRIRCVHEHIGDGGISEQGVQAACAE